MFCFPGPSAVLKGDRLAVGKPTSVEQNFLFDYFIDKPLEELQFDESDLNNLPRIHDPFIFDVNSGDIEMFSPLRERKCSISDILDVLNEDKNLFSRQTNDDGYDSGQTHSPSGISGDESFTSEELFDKNSDELNLSKCKDQNDENALHYVAMKASPITTATYDKVEVMESKDASMLCNPVLLMSDKDAVIVLMDGNKQIKYLSTSKEKLQTFLRQESSSFAEVKALRNENDMQESTQGTNISPDTSLDTSSSKLKPSKRGRKRIYECADDTEREDSKRIRNNEACRKFRKSKTEKLKTLFDNELKLLQQNTKLKEQISQMECQLDYIKEKLGIKDYEIKVSKEKVI